MRHSLRSRATSVLLAVLFLGGVGGASDLDAFLFHHVGTDVFSNVPRVETAGNPSCHADRCVLGLRLASGSAAHVPALPVRLSAVPAHAAVAQPDAAPPRFHPGLHLQSRAPPSSLL